MFITKVAILGLCLLFLISLGCAPQVQSPNVSNQPEDDKPPYIEKVWPLPDSATPYEEYLNFSGMEQGVGFKLIPLLLNPELLERKDQLISTQPVLYINEEQISNDNLLVSDGLLQIDEINGQPVEIAAGPYWYSWPLELPNGQYEAIVVITDTHNIRHEYSWVFEITE